MKLVKVSGKKKQEEKIVNSEIWKANDGHWPGKYFKKNFYIGIRIEKKLNNLLIKSYVVIFEITVFLGIEF